MYVVIGISLLPTVEPRTCWKVGGFQGQHRLPSGGRQDEVGEETQCALSGNGQNITVT